MQEKPVDIQFIAERVLRIEQHLEEQKAYDKAMKWRKAIDAERARREERALQREKEKTKRQENLSLFFGLGLLGFVWLLFHIFLQ